MSDETTVVAPVLVRDHRRLLRLFPFAFRRAHEAEMLGHLLDGAAPGQSRPTRGERWDLLRAAAREWVLAPYGSTAQQRRAATGWLLVVLPLVLVPPAAIALGSTAAALWVHDGAVFDGQVGNVLAWAPLLASWVLWVVGMFTLAAGLVRAAWIVLAAGAAVGWMLLLGLSAVGTLQGGLFPVLSGIGWVVGQTALAGAVALRAAALTGTTPETRWLPSALAAAVAAAVPAAAVIYPAVSGADWWGAGARNMWWLDVGTSTLVVSVGVVAALFLSSRRARQALPVLAGVGTAVVLGRIGLFASSFRQLDVVDLGHVITLVAISLGVTVAARWVVNRLDELSDARAALGPGAEQAVDTVLGAQMRS